MLLLLNPVTLMAEQEIKIIDARDTGDQRASAGNQWRLVTDHVMGGVSQGELSVEVIEDRPCLRMRGDVSLENNGGFIQIALDLPEEILREAPAYTGLVLEVYGNDQDYNVHLRTDDIWLPWQSYRATFTATPRWQVIYLPFEGFEPHRIDTAFNVSRLERIGLVAIGREFSADLCIGKIGFYK
jgi:hypothetical protein